MANEVNSIYMSLPVPVVGTDPGPQYAIDVNSCLTIIDQHSHLPGSGVPIVSDAISINADLAFNNNNLTSARAIRFQPQSAPIPATGADIGEIYEAGVDLYYNDGLGNQIRITQGGGIAGTPGSITGLAPPASVTYVSADETFVFQSDVNTPANLDAASIVLRNLVANSHGLTLSPPNAMGADYTITLPALPGSTLPVSISSTGTMSAAQITTAQIANLAVTDAQIANQTITQDKLALRTVGTTAPAGGVAISTSTGSVTLTGSFVTYCTVTITTTGRPVMLLFQGDGTTNGSFAQNGAASSSPLTIAFFRGATQTSTYVFDSSNRDSINPSCTWVDTPIAGTYTYTIQAMIASFAWDLNYMELVAYEL